MKITTRAVESGGRKVMACEAGLRLRHTLRVREGACPYSKNPIRGKITIQYKTTGYALEVVDLERYVQWVTGGRDGAPMSAEEIAVRAARDLRAALDTPVSVRLVLLVNPGPQVLRVGYKCN